MQGIINKTMDRSDLLTGEAKSIVEELNGLIRRLNSRGLSMSSWYGTIPEKPGLSVEKLKQWVRRSLGRPPQDSFQVGLDNRGPDYEALPGAGDDGRIPWFLYWEIIWAITRGPRLAPGMRVLDAGGVSSLLSCYLASLGYEVHSIDLSKRLVANADQIAGTMGWRLYSYAMNMKKLAFEDEFFDHAYSICVFEHLDKEVKRAALLEIARCLKPEGILSITFDYRNPAPPIWNYGYDTRPKNRLQSEDDIRQTFLTAGRFVLLGNQKFYDNGLSYLVHPDPKFRRAPYTFGSIFLMKRA